MNTWKILSVAIAIITLGLWVVPGWEDLNIIQKDIDTLQTTKDLKIKEIKLIKDEIKKSTNSAESVLEIIPFSREQEIIIRDLKNISKQTSFTFGSLSFGKGWNPTLNTAQTTVAFTVLGPKNKISTFLGLLDKNTRFIGTDNLNLSIKEKEGLPIAEIKISLYALSQEASK